jgi:uncharacterized protein YyaL (SSP411 family)
MGGSRYGVTNRLASATSPYLRQHAENPVDWYEWGDEAFAEARRRDVPILLSVGYAACHWCHEAEDSRKPGPRAAEARETLACMHRG